MKPLAFFVPGEPRGKGRPRATTINGHARMYADAKTATYENLIRLAACNAMGGGERFDGPVSLMVTAILAVPASASKRAKAAMLAMQVFPTKRPDLDNTIKAILDALNTVAFKDDAQVVSIVAHKVYGQTPGLRVTVGQYEHPLSQAVAA